MGDAFDDYEERYMDPFDACISDRAQKESKVCDTCGEKNLHWEKHNGRWRLFSGIMPHVCDESSALEDFEGEFDDYDLDN